MSGPGIGAKGRAELMEPRQRRNVECCHPQPSGETGKPAAGTSYRPIALWLTGLPGAGKSTIGRALDQRFRAASVASYLLDADEVRARLNSDLGFSAEDRTENLRRAAEVTRMMVDAGLIVVAAFISPLQVDRQRVRQIVGYGTFVEVFVDTSLEECERRDPKGMYGKARANLMHNFTGISAPYEPPTQPDVHIRTELVSIGEAVTLICGHLERVAGLPDKGDATAAE